MGSVDGGLSRLQKSFLTRRQKNKDFFETNLTKNRFDKIGGVSPKQAPRAFGSENNGEPLKSVFQLIVSCTNQVFS